MALGEHDLRPPLLRNKETRNLLPSLNWQKHWSQEPDSVRSNRTGSTASTLSPTGEASGSNPVKSGFESQRVYALLAQRRGSWLKPGPVRVRIPGSARYDDHHVLRPTTVSLALAARSWTHAGTKPGCRAARQPT